VSLFVDTSALLAVLDADEEHHRQAARIWTRVLGKEEPLLTTNYVVVETIAIVQRRLGIGAVSTLVDDLLPAIEIEWVTRDDHAAAAAALLAARRTALSFVDCASFQVMRRLGIGQAFVFDRHFEEQGFRCLK